MVEISNNTGSLAVCRDTFVINSFLVRSITFYRGFERAREINIRDSTLLKRYIARYPHIHAGARARSIDTLYFDA